MPTNIVDFIRENPDCGVTDLVRGCDMDAGDIWSAIVDADRTQAIIKERRDDGWHFRLRDGA